MERIMKFGTLPQRRLHQRLIGIVVVAQCQRAIGIDLLPARPTDRITHSFHFELSFQPQPLPLRRLQAASAWLDELPSASDIQGRRSQRH